MWLLGQKIDVLRNQQGPQRFGDAASHTNLENVAAALLSGTSSGNTTNPSSSPDFSTPVVGNLLNSSDASKLQSFSELNSMLLGSKDDLTNQLKQVELAYREANVPPQGLIAAAVAQPAAAASQAVPTTSLLELATQRQLLEQQQKASLAATLVNASFAGPQDQGRLAVQNNSHNAFAAIAAALQMNNQGSVSTLQRQQDLQVPQERLCNISNNAQTSLGLDHVHRSKQSFPEKVYFMLEEVEKTGDEHVISFVDDGKAFLIHKPRIFETDVMPLFFASRRMSSFQRQLNIYGFERINEGPFRGAYKHASFIKGKKDLLSGIQRIEKHSKSSKSSKKTHA